MGSPGQREGGEGLIEIHNLTKKYGSHIAVDHLSFQVERGKIYGFLGPNGAGKTTTMNMITGYIGATEGEVRINGYDILESPEQAKKCIGYLPEIPPLYMDMTPNEYLKFVAELKGIGRDEREAMIRDIMETTKITDVQHRLIKNLSKGYRQRVGLAQALIGYPEVIILDEPTVGLDPKQIIEIRDLIKSLGDRHTVILSSHILSEVSAVCDHVLIISKGKLVASDRPENLSAHLAEKMQLSLTIMGEERLIRETLRLMPEIRKYEIHHSVEDGAWDIELTAGEQTDIRKKLFSEFAKLEYPILKMQSSGKSLEDVFLELTQDEQAADGKEEA